MFTIFTKLCYKLEMDKFILVTGASSGLGKEIAQTLALKGFKVFAGVRKEEDKKILENLHPDISVVFLDVTSQNSIDSAFEEIQKKTDNLHALINNAGIALAGPVECMPVDIIKNQFEVNVYGSIRTAQKFLPMLEAGNGRIVNISSMASFGIFPFISPYCASKRALDIFFNALLLECKMPELKVISIKPGVVKTKIWDKSIDACKKIIEDMPEKFKEKYRSENEFLVKNAEKNNNKGLEPREIAELVHKVLTVKNPKLSYSIGLDAKMTELYSKLPLCVINFCAKKVMKKRFKSQ